MTEDRVQRGGSGAEQERVRHAIWLLRCAANPDDSADKRWLATRALSWLARGHDHDPATHDLGELLDETARHPRVEPSDEERCGGTGVLPPGGHEGTTRYACPGCEDCEPAPERNHDD